MRYRVELTDRAWKEVQEAYDWLAARAPVAADRWKSRLLEAIQQLERNPRRCSLAPESEYFRREIRQLLYGKRNSKYRVLFEVVGQQVNVLRVRHGARQVLDEE